MSNTRRNLRLNTVVCGDVLNVLKTFPDRCIDLVVTSPPYYGLRRYADLPEVIWGGNEGCEHQWLPAMDGGLLRDNRNFLRGSQSSLVGAKGTTFIKSIEGKGLSGAFCATCGAWRGHYGLEPSVDMYIAHTLLWCAEVHRVLKDTGSFWLNLGDSYTGSGKGQNADGSPGPASKLQQSNKGSVQGGLPTTRFDKWRSGIPGSIQVCHQVKGADLPAGNKLLLPHRVAIALQAQGWVVRQDNVWAKMNCMPEPVKGWRWERCTIATSQKELPDNPSPSDIARAFGCDPDALCPVCGRSWKRHASLAKDRRAKLRPSFLPCDRSILTTPCPGCPKCISNGGWILRKGSGRTTTAHEYIFHLVKEGCSAYYDTEAVRLPFAPSTINRANYAFYPDHPKSVKFSKENAGLVGRNAQAFNQEKYAKIRDGDRSGANARSVFPWATEAFAGEHFATFPKKLPEFAIKAGTSEYGNCPKCGTPWSRMIELGQHIKTAFGVQRKVGISHYPAEGCGVSPVHHKGWRCSCKCGLSETVRPIVLDPFLGSGTTAIVAESLNRNWIGIELSATYCKMAVERIREVGTPLFSWELK